MARYIDADALIENLKKQYGEELGWLGTVNMSDVGMMIEDAPTANVIKDILSDLKKCIHDKAVFPYGVETYSFVSLKVVDGILQTFINKYTER